MEIALLGPVELRTGTGEHLPVAGARLRTLVVLLALDAGRTVSADRLIDGVWGDAPPAAAGNALQALVSRLRRTAPELLVEATPTGYRLVTDPDRVDAHRFTKLAAGAPGQALALWRGDLEFPEVAAAEAVRLTELRRAAQRDWLAGEMAHRDVVPELEALVAAHPLDETLIALLIRALRRAGNPARALEVFEVARSRLADQLGADPSAELVELHLELLRSERGTAPRGNLPAEVSSFVGRDADVRRVRELVGGHRLVTLIGPGGSGKTRLSVEVGARLPGEVWRVELAPVRDAAEVPQAVLTALNLRGQVTLTRPGGGAVVESLPPLVRLRDALAGREMLLVLDNCEHLIDAAAVVADVLLRFSPGVRLIATSREPLGIPGELLFPVEPLALPPVGADVSTAAGFPAVRLLLDRASGFELTGETTEPVIRVCRALDGMPLAIELAAARLRTLPVTVLADRLADRFRLLTGGSRTTLPRHQTLRAMVDWSWDLLTEPEQQLWRRLAALPGGAEVTAVEEVCGAGLDVIGALVDKSLVVLGRDGRYRMLETIREYGLERLDEAGETALMRTALATHLLALIRTAEPRLRGAGQLEWLRRLGEEHDNLHAAVRDAITAGDRETAVSLVANLGWYWWLRGHRTEGSELCVEVLAMSGPQVRAETEPRYVAELALAYVFSALNGVEGPMQFSEVKAAFWEAERLAEGVRDHHPVLRLLTPLAMIYSGMVNAGAFGGAESLDADPDPWLRAVARMFIGQVRLNLGEPAEAEADLRAALAGFRTIGERWGIGFTLSALADLTAARGDFALALGWQREALALVEEVGLQEDLPQLTVKMACQLWLAGDREEAHRMLELARRYARGIGIPEVMASVHHGHATIARAEGDLAAAREHNEEAARLIEGSTFAPQFRAITHSTRALIAGAAGDLALARKQHREAMRLAAEVQDSPVIAQVMVGMADLALREGDPARAAYLLGAAESVRGSVDRTISDAERITREARGALGDAGFDAAFRRGDGVTMTSALAASGSDAAAEGADGEWREDAEQDGGPDQ
ncbi:BTAD domain-containing putative transcriptional regulator [Actinoplanes sp. GCM10030250]|uniref:BTAD domain-containing putative transcriptional regulator n=1 Tax=Actinoplanes sp. GCM10030250 TaxID=3273376 RepID=UPI003618B7D6